MGRCCRFFACVLPSFLVCASAAAQAGDHAAKGLPALPAGYKALPSNVLDASTPLPADGQVPGTRQAAIDQSYVREHMPKYPVKAMDDRHEGITETTVALDEKGAVVGVRVDKSSGDAGLDATAVKAVVGWKYLACYVDYVPRVCWAREPVVFSLNGPRSGG